MTIKPAFLQKASQSVRTAAGTACAVLRSAYGGPLEISTKSSWKDLVTNADLASEKAILDSLRTNHPEIAALTEEGDGKVPDEELFWIIDPLDGTTNFAHSYPQFSVSIALVQRSEQELIPLVGVVAHPLTGMVYHAVRGGGAYLGDSSLNIKSPETLHNALMGTGFHFDTGDDLEKTLTTFKRILEEISSVRRSGSAALDICAVAQGLDGFWEFGINIWDAAAGIVIIREAGGVAHFLPPENGHRSLTFAVAPGIAQEFTRLLLPAHPGVEKCLIDLS